MPNLFIHITGQFPQSVNLKPGSETRQLWEKMPFPLTFKIYVFNVTNAQDIEMGGKPKLQEVGPFVYDEWKDKYELMDIEAENAISFNMRNTFQTRADLGLSGEELITMPHPLLQVSPKTEEAFFMTIANLEQPAETLATVALGLDIIFKPQSAFITAKFKDLFYAGIDINCDQEHAAAQAICQQFQAGAVPGALPVNATHYKFSLMGAGNHTNAGRFKVSRSRSRQSSVGRVLAFNEAKQLHIWPELNNTSCNRLRGTDGTIFAPLMRPEQGLWSYSPQLCRSLTPQWMGRTKYNRLPAQRYELNFGSARVSLARTTFKLNNQKKNIQIVLEENLISTKYKKSQITRKNKLNQASQHEQTKIIFFQTEPDLHCYCTDYPDNCPADGTMDLVRCSGTPLMASLPHFYQADQKLLAEVEGVQPTAAKHASILIFEQFSGTVLSVHNRLQFSLKVAPVKDVPLMSQLRSLAMPLFWIEESLQLDEQVTQLLHKKIFA
nr:sensory neuron membrane protein 1 [Drosophila virilis]